MSTPKNTTSTPAKEAAELETKEQVTTAPVEEQEVATASVQDDEVELSILDKARKIVRNHTYISTGIGLIPLPVIDIAAVSANQLTMLARLSSLYDVPYRKNIAKSFLSVLLYDLSAAGTVRIASSLMKSIPIIGQITGAIAMSGYSLAATYAIGQVFIQHFEAGGTFLDFKPEKVKAHFKEQFEEGKKFASDVQKKGKDKMSRMKKNNDPVVAEPVVEPKEA